MVLMEKLWMQLVLKKYFILECLKLMCICNKLKKKCSQNFKSLSMKLQLVHLATNVDDAL